MNAELLVNTKCVLGEGPMWHAERNSLWWVDIEDKKIFEFGVRDGQLKGWQLTRRVSLIVQIMNSNDLLIAIDEGIARFNIITGNVTMLQPLEQNLSENRSNDGACDGQGRLWLGTMHIKCEPGRGTLYSINEKLDIEKKIKGTTISNGIVWNENFSKLYYIDSATYKVQSYDYDLKTGDLGTDKTVIEIPENIGMPDGMAIDAEGMLWIAIWGGYGIYRYNPFTGTLIEKISVPAPHVTSCVFGGKNFEYLFITTARQSVNEELLQKHPLSGSVFVAKPGVNGCGKNKFKLEDS